MGEEAGLDLLLLDVTEGLFLAADEVEEVE